MSLLDEIFQHVTDDSYVCPLPAACLQSGHTGARRCARMHSVGHSRLLCKAQLHQLANNIQVRGEKSKVKKTLDLTVCLLQDMTPPLNRNVRG